MKMPVTSSMVDKDLNSLEKKEFYRLLVNSIQDYAIFLLDTKGNISSWNKGAQKLKGYTPEEIIGKHFSIFYTKEDIDKDKPARELRECRANGRIEDEYWRVKKGGGRFWANVVITALYDPNGKLIGFAKITRDLTERKLYEDELRIANQRLREQQAQLQALNIAKDEFISLASHQLRTPATGVKQFLGLTLEGYGGPLTDKQQDFLTKAYESNNRQIDLVNNMLQVAQVDAGKVVLQKTQVDVAELLKDIIGEQDDTFKKRSQTVKLELGPNPVIAQADKMRFRMVLENIIDNASKYTPHGGTISVDVRGDELELVVAITDTGVGIDTEALPGLFSKFSRIANELSDAVGGSGLGLYWAYKIMQLHGGDIQVTSKRHEGTTFNILLPLGENNG